MTILKSIRPAESKKICLFVWLTFNVHYCRLILDKVASDENFVLPVAQTKVSGVVNILHTCFLIFYPPFCCFV